MKQFSIISSAVAAALFSQSSIAAVITGQVVDKNQQPVVNAQVHVHGKSQAVMTDAQGEFKIDVDSKGQLHVSKDNFIDKRVDINGDDQSVVVTLTPTSVETVVVYASGHASAHIVHVTLCAFSGFSPSSSSAAACTTALS